MGGVAAIAVAYVLHGALVRMLAESDPRFHMSFALDPLVLAFVAGGDPRRGAAVRRASGLAGHQGRRRSEPQGTEPRRRRLVWPAALGPIAGEPATGAFPAPAGWRRSAGADRLQPAARRPRLSRRASAARAGRPARGGAPTPRAATALLRELLGQLQQIPGVRAASFSQLGVFTGGESSDHDRSRRLHAARETTTASPPSTWWAPATSRRWASPSCSGRDILESDRGARPKVCVINEAFAKRFFDRRNPIGMRVTIGR